MLCPVDFVADRGGCNSDSPRVSGFGTASATPLIERSTAPSPSTAAELSGITSMQTYLCYTKTYCMNALQYT